MSDAQQVDQDNEAWIESVGGLTEATLLVRDILKCGLSKAEKVARGRYPSALSEAERKALAELMKRSKRRKKRALVTRSLQTAG